MSDGGLRVVRDPVVVRAPAKINLLLGVGDLRPDGYHDLSTVFQAVSLYDEIEVLPAAQLSVAVIGEQSAVVPTDRTNLAWRAAELLARKVGRPADVAITIRKGIPVAGGMAGGSADAAGTLLALDTLWGCELSRDELSALAAKLGSDVPFSLHGNTALGTGRGERLVPTLSRGRLEWVLALAKGGLSTPEVYGELDRLRAAGDPPRVASPDGLLRALAAGDVDQVAAALGNDLQAAALSLMPILRRTLRAGVEAGALAGIVSGSGPTCAFLCADGDAALKVAAELAGAGVSRTIRLASGPVGGARTVERTVEGFPG
ncbi:4-(cytidine 5'-diphospho)-2-C-methyl-D-erythritol kinase [Millisia brevis]|uniref:4-(cytidine 5'-diphospho)-2-C-methyl-D-erythritol kinase n=1 Tax=Millisia brevis TaxID=264148 RepID=UPI00082A8B38|nr:4-(cytidine 5'-diphospho)-2-C-methyl-D-erythritol kinase [Millisia brevis]